MAEATVAGGCFWCIDAALAELEGVESTTSGYTGGHVEEPSYEAVCREETGHAEAVRVEYDPDRIAYADLLEVFFSIHDPTTEDRQGPDVGSQYRSAVYYHDETQKRTVEAFVDELDDAGVYAGSIVTEIEPIGEFYVAEAHHQDYFEKNPDKPYCAAQVLPKVEKVREEFEALTARDDATVVED